MIVGYDGRGIPVVCSVRNIICILLLFCIEDFKIRVTDMTELYFAWLVVFSVHVI